ncbi:MAG: LON peptidase substrate-binding domain-containing protein, partial [Clostridia bacterium]|nr:LON peptidase substrate-binding domain-containing protein [Clostridia bacterium]
MPNIKPLDCRELPVLALRGLVAFPSMLLTLDVGRKKSMAALEVAMSTDRYNFLLTQTDITVENPQKKDLYKIGCIC